MFLTVGRRHWEPGIKVSHLSQTSECGNSLSLGHGHKGTSLWCCKGLCSSYRLFWRRKVPQELRSHAFNYIPRAQWRRLFNVLKCFWNAVLPWNPCTYPFSFSQTNVTINGLWLFQSFRIAFSGLKNHFMIYFISKCKMAWETSIVFWQIVKPEVSVYVWPHWIEQL